MSVWAENLDGAQVVKYECDIVGIFAWFGGSTLRLFCADTGEELNIRTDYNIEDRKSAILAIERWINDLYSDYEEQHNYPNDSYEDAEALASAGYGTDEDYGG